MKDNCRDYVVNKLKSYHKDQVIISEHARIRLIQRQIDPKEIIENIINPKRLDFAIKEEASSPDEEKFDCYFGYSKTQCHKYVLVLKDNIIVITAIKINRRWQRIVESKMRER
ncbi:MAG: DUF4258 domain-containing protein [Candidatus Woesearchaeota archaeon]